MLTLIDTVIGFAVIMLLLSFVIKSLTTVLKNHVQFYTQNFRSEFERLLKPLTSMTLQKLEDRLGGIDWRNVGDELLEAKTLKPILARIDSTLDLSDLEARIAVHKSALQFSFEKRMKNLTLACGLALCLLLNVNAFAIWQTLYEDDQMRAKFASEAYVDEVLAGQEDPASTSPETREALEKERQAWLKDLEGFREDVSFGIGAVWRSDDEGNPPGFAKVLYEFLGSLLTGFLASVGAPYLHDLLRMVSSFRKGS